jgi:hypothetical protein
MFKLIKLAIYGFLGYTLYQMYQGMSQGGGQGIGGQMGRSMGQGMGGGGGNFGGAPSAGQFTGGGEGMRESSLEPTGMSASHRVGRGVVSR